MIFGNVPEKPRWLNQPDWGYLGILHNDKSGDTTGWCFQIFAGTATYQMSMSSKMVHTTSNDRSR